MKTRILVLAMLASTLVGCSSINNATFGTARKVLAGVNTAVGIGIDAAENITTNAIAPIVSATKSATETVTK